MEKKHKTVRAFAETPSRFLDMIYDAKTKRYFAPSSAYLNEIKKSMKKYALTGKGDTAAILDTGMLTHHPFIHKRIVASVDFTSEGPEDQNGHGTIVTLLFLSIAPGASILNVKVLDRDKEGLEEDLIKGLRWAQENGATSINLSLGIEREEGCGGTCDVCREATRIVKSGVIITAAKGNTPGLISCPASCQKVASVGAANLLGVKIADGSTRVERGAPDDIILVPVKKFLWWSWLR